MGHSSFCCTIFFSSHHWCCLFLLKVQSVYIVAFKMSVLFLGSLLKLLVPFLVCICLLCSLVTFFGGDLHIFVWWKIIAVIVVL